MKKTLVALAILGMGFAHAQTTVDSTSGSASQAGAQSGSISGVNANNSGNVSAVGNENSSRSNSASSSGASSGSQSGALGNAVYIDQSGPSSQTVNSTANVNQTTRAEQILNGHTTEDVNVHNSGGTRNETVQSGTVTNRFEYSGTQTVKNVPSIAMSGPASGPCTGVSGGLSGAGPGWGFGFNASSVMADCRMRENTRVLGMAMQSLDGAANPQEKGEVTVLFMDAVRGLAAYNNQIVAEEVKAKK